MGVVVPVHHNFWLSWHILTCQTICIIYNAPDPWHVSSGLDVIGAVSGSRDTFVLQYIGTCKGKLDAAMI